MSIQFILARPEHCDLLFIWANDQVVRNNSFHTDVIDYGDHVNWFQRKLDSEECILFICYYEKEPVGQIRIEIDGPIGWINYSIAKVYRGKGYGTNILRNLPYNPEIKKRGVKKLLGRVKHENVASQKAFEKAEYDCIKTQAYMEYSKTLEP